MSSIIITRGLPLGLLINLKNFDERVDLNNGDWNFEIKLKHKTTNGQEPFALSTTPANTSVMVELTEEQTLLLDSNENDYVFVVKVSKTDGTVNLRNTLLARAVNDL